MLNGRNVRSWNAFVWTACTITSWVLHSCWKLTWNDSRNPSYWQWEQKLKSKHHKIYFHNWNITGCTQWLILTSRTFSNYVDEDYSARPKIKQSVPGWGDICGSESSTLETDVCVWRYAPLVVHATHEEEEAGEEIMPLLLRSLLPALA